MEIKKMEIVAEYRVYNSWDLEELEIDRNDIKEYFVKYNRLFVFFKDGSEEEFEPTSNCSEDFDYKYPSDTFEQ